MSDKIKTLSQAIRLGATFRPQGFGALFDDDKSCAIGAAGEALGFTKGEHFSTDDIKDRFPMTGALDSFCPMCSQDDLMILRSIPRNAIGLVIHLNDQHQWSREQIADWLEGQGK